MFLSNEACNCALRYLYRCSLAFAVLIVFFPPPIFAELRIGDQAPNLMGFDAVSGRRLNLYRIMTDMRFKRDVDGNLLVKDNGKYVTEFIPNITVLNFFARTCIPCLREIPTLNKVAGSFKGKSVKFLYINVDPELDEIGMKRLISRYKIHIPVMLPNQNEAMRKYDAVALPRLVVIDKQKKVSDILIGYHEDLAEILSTTIHHLLKKSVE